LRGRNECKGHLGDLPSLFVGTDGKAVTAVSATRLKMANVKGRSLMIHAGGDNYADLPAPLGGGARVVCGVIKERFSRRTLPSDGSFLCFP